MTHIDTRSDETLLALARDGTPAAFGVVYDRHQAHALRIALRVCRQRETAEDVLQQAFLEVWRGADSFDPSRGTVAGWIATVVRHRAIDAMRHQAVPGRRVVAGSAAEAVATDDTAGAVGDHAEANVMDRALRRLPAAQREVLVLSYGGEFSQAEIATRLGIPLGTVKGRVRLGLRSLRAVPEVADLPR